MKRIINTLIISAVLMLAFSCRETEFLEVDMNESIVLDLSSGLTKAESENAEAVVNHLDVFIFKAVQSGSETHGERVYYGRYSVNNATSITLDAKRSSFSKDDRFYVYLIANSTCSEEEMAGLETYNDLQTLKQEDRYIHLTGLTADNAPAYFLMDAIATQGTEKASRVQLFNGVASDNTVLDAVLRRAAAKVQINITAGADVDFHHFADDPSSRGMYYVRNLPYDTYVLSGVSASMIEAKRRTTTRGGSAYFGWHPETDSKTVTLTAYVYPHHWEDASILDQETCVIMNLPMISKKGQTGERLHKQSWYKIHMTGDQKFERNNYYQVNIELNAPGAVEDSNPQVLNDIVYSVQEWNSVNVEVGGENRPNYLQLNTDHVDMYNVNIDESTLKFASSSFIPADGIELLEAYYMNYLDQRVNLQTKNPTVYGNITSVATPNVLNGSITINSPFVAKTEAEIESEILALGAAPSVPQEPTDPEVSAPDADEIVGRYNENQYGDRYKIKYSGQGANVKFSPVSTRPVSTATTNARAAQNEYDAAYEAWAAWNALSDAEKEARRQEYQTLLAAYTEASAIYTEYQKKVAQIRASSENSHSNAIRYMKFRVRNSTGQTAEFTVAQYPTIYITNEGGAYSYRSDFGGTNYERQGNPNRSGANWNNGIWTYTETASGSNFFASKVVVGDQIHYVDWEDGRRSTSDIGVFDNPRMYHIHVTATSKIYTVAVPRLDANGYTESTAENTRLVSPSFMTASQLGATEISAGGTGVPGGVDQAKQHCEQYVEVTGDGVVYDDWRLPTAAEIDIIIQHQDASEAMAVVLSGSRYYCAYNTDANGRVIYTKETGKYSGKSHVRCVRDAY